ncbi:hypothetical protein EU538_10775 [Candidatus Thorarchaeota archaeon]|nr:MAG: hypothetical protein EU538_10775 [Candidatus Thorarchaeota archaeon]
MAGTRGYPRHPERVLASALYAGLAALYRLADQMLSDYDKKAYDLLTGINNMWRETRRSLKEADNDLTALFNIEPNMRKSFLGMLWQLTVPYGNREFKRVYRWSEGAIGPLNALLNYAGAQLRALAMRLFPFPRPTYYQIREHPDGTIQTLHRSTAMKHPAAEGIKTRWIAAYPGNRTHPTFRVRHPTLPELDFVDMIRAHVVELVRQCFIHNVPRATSQRYIRLLIHRLAPFLEWKYTEGESGRKDFWPDADRELREIVTEIKVLYRRHVGRRTRLTQQLEENPASATTKLFKKQIQAAAKRDRSAEMKKTVAALRRHLRAKNVTDGDAQVFVEDVLHATSLEGNRWHRMLAHGFYQPNSLREAVFHGDKHQRTPGDVMIACEMPVETPLGHGKADIVVLVRREVAGQPLWLPFMVLDIKTKTGVDWAPYSRKPRTEKKGTRVFITDLRKRTLTEKEWNGVKVSSPRDSFRAQVELYEQGILNELRTIICHHEVLPAELWQGIVRIDTGQGYEDVRRVLRWLIMETVRDLREGKQNTTRPLLYEPVLAHADKQQPRVALFLRERKGPRKLFHNTSPLQDIIIKDPFAKRRRDDRVFTLYLSVASAVSSGESAAWVARNWHLLHYLKDLTERDEQPEIVWLDLMGCFSTLDHALSRLRITGALTPRGLGRTHLQALRNLVRSIRFVDLHGMVQGLSDSGQRSLDTVESQVKSNFKTDATKRVIVVDGWPELRETIPPSDYALLGVLQQRLLEWLPESNCEIIWLDKPVPLPTTSEVYQMHEVAPLPYDSPLMEHLDVIIWNKPTRPRFLGWRAPMLEYVRVIEVDTPTSAVPHSELIVVPQLHGWGRRFRADTSDDRQLREREVEELIRGPKYARGHWERRSHRYVLNSQDLTDDIITESLVLSPCILRPRTSGDTWGSEMLSQISVEPALQLKRIQLKPPSPSGLFERVRLVPAGRPPRRSRWGDDTSKRYHPVDAITRSWRHREEEESSAFVRETVRPPLIGAVGHDVTIESTGLEELRLTRRASGLVLDRLEEYEFDRRTLLEKVITECNRFLKFRNEVTVVTALGRVRDTLSSHKDSRVVWRHLRNARQKTVSSDVLPPSALESLGRSRTSGRELAELYGNDLFILILGVLWSGVEVHPARLQTLWMAHCRWTLVHMGFCPLESEDDILQSRYNQERILLDLRWRAKHLAQMPDPLSVVRDYSAGLLVFFEGSNEWLVFEESPGSDRMLFACLERPMDVRFPPGFYQCVRNPKELGWGGIWEDTFPIVIQHTDQGDVLWTGWTEDSETNWWPRGLFSYGPPPAGQVIPVRWFRIERLPPDMRVTLQAPAEFPDKWELEEKLADCLDPLESVEGGIISVRCRVAIDPDRECYVMEMTKRRPAWPGIYETVCSFDVERTDQLIRKIRGPSLSGEPFLGEYFWDHRTDVDYEEVDTPSGAIDMSFVKPFVLRSRRGSAFLRQLMLPESAADLLNTKMGDRVSLVADPDLKRMRGPRSRCWNILFLGIELNEMMNALSRIDVNIVEVAQIFEMKQLVDMTTGVRHPTVVAVNNLGRVQLSDEVRIFPRMAAWLASGDMGEGTE